MMESSSTLQGVLGDEGCSDVFQLLGRQNKVGVLELRNRYGAVDIWLNAGVAVRVDDMNREEKWRLGELLIRAGLITQQQLLDALAAQRKTRRRLGELLVEKAGVTANAVSNILKLQARETLYNAFMIRRGTFSFVAGKRTAPAPELEGGLRWELVLMEAGRRQWEWPRIREVIPSNEATLHVLAPLPEGRSPSHEALELMDFPEPGAAPAAAPEPPDEDAEERTSTTQAAVGESALDFPDEHDRLVYSRITPGSTVRRVIDLSGLGHFLTCRALWRLATEGCVAAIPDADDLPEVEADELQGDDTAQRELYLFHDALRSSSKR